MGFILREQKGSKLTIQEMDGNLEFLYNLDQLKLFKPGSVGDKVSFTKVSGTDPATNKDVIIPGELEITRGNSGSGIFNIAVEPNYNIGNGSPENTFWNTIYQDDANFNWAPVWDIQNRSYTDWRDAIRIPNDDNDPAPPMYVGLPAVMKWDNGSDPERYWLIMFTHWGVGNNDDYGFAYDRLEILPSVYFEKPSGQTSTVDEISEGVHLARQNNGGLYNAVNETYSIDGASPLNTRWNSEYVDGRPGYSGWYDLSNLESRIYSSFVDALDGAVGDNLPGTDLVMHDLTTDLYYKMDFQEWQSGGGSSAGAFAYDRTVIPQSNGIKFADGSVINTGSTASGSTSSGPIALDGQSLYTTTPITSAPSSDNGIYFGYQAGVNAINAYRSVFLGYQAGVNAINSNDSNFLGYNAGFDANNTNNSNFFGYHSGYNADSANNSNFLGYNAGYDAGSSSNSNFLGPNAGAQAPSASNCNFFGSSAGQNSSGNDVNAFGVSAGLSNTLSGQTIFSNASMPTFANHADAAAAITVVLGASAGSTYLYHNQATNSIGAVRL